MKYKRVPRTSLKVGDEFKIMPNSSNTHVIQNIRLAYNKIFYMDRQTGKQYYMYDNGDAYIKSKVYPQRSRKI